jgi:hypothetical protein
MARKTWPNPCTTADMAGECTEMPNEVLTGMSECRALMVIAPAQCSPMKRPEAAFVTQLIACERRIGAYRTARRAAPTDAAGFYAARLGVGSRSFQRLV